VREGRKGGGWCFATKEQGGGEGAKEDGRKKTEEHLVKKRTCGKARIRIRQVLDREVRWGKKKVFSLVKKPSIHVLFSVSKTK